MPPESRLRRLLPAALTVALTLFVAGCVENPNSIFHNRTDFNRDVDDLFQLLIWLGTVVFVFTEALLIYALFRFRHRPGTPRQPEQTHGNTKLEILWTIIPAVVLAVIAVPTVQTIFKTQGIARGDALQVEVIGHQWWWEFRYPQYNVTTANELYLPLGRTVSFALKTTDVIHSFWIPALGGKRDNVNNRTNHLWFTPDSTTEAAFNGFCAEYCGTSHANMRFRAFTVTPEQFASWVAHQQSPPAIRSAMAVAAAGAQPAPPAQPAQPAPATPAATQAGFVAFAREKMPHHAVPQTPIPSSITFDESLRGDPARGAQLVTAGSCVACHTIAGEPTMRSTIGPNLTHVGSRLTIAGGLFPNDTRHLAAWIKNSRAMKPGVLMPTLARGQHDPITKSTLTIGLSDQDVADIVAYLQALK